MELSGCRRTGVGSIIWFDLCAILLLARWQESSGLTRLASGDSEKSQLLNATINQGLNKLI